MKEGETIEEEPILSSIPKAKKNDIIQHDSKPKCKDCGYVGEMEKVNRHGCTSISWIVCLFLFTGILFWIPMATNKCKDKVTVCPNCN